MRLETRALIEQWDEIERVVGKVYSQIFRTLLINAKEERLVVCEIALSALNFEIDSPQITPMRKAEAIHQRDTVLVQWGEIMTELSILSA